MENCKKCGNQIAGSSVFCSECGTKKDVPQKSFRLDMSREANMKGLLAILFLIVMRVLAPMVGSYLIAGAISGLLVAVLGSILNKNK